METVVEGMLMRLLVVKEELEIKYMEQEFLEKGIDITAA